MYASTLPSVVLYLIDPLAGDAGRSAVVPIGIARELFEVVFDPYCADEFAFINAALA
jgi:hypothetical protein